MNSSAVILTALFQLLRLRAVEHDTTMVRCECGMSCEQMVKFCFCRIYYPGICLDGLRKNAKGLIQDSVSSARMRIVGITAAQTR
jgi:hypothetical protein